MKKIMFTLFVCCCIFRLTASEVPISTIKTVAINAFSYYSGEVVNSNSLTDVIPLKRGNVTMLYVCNFNNGFVLVSADNVAQPILGYGLTQPFDTSNIAPATAYLVESYKEEILDAKSKKSLVSEEISANWSKFINYNPTKSFYNSTTYLIQTTWDQRFGTISTYPYTYNYYCPVVENDNTLAGCGAVALGQVLRYWTCNVYPHGIIKHSVDTIDLSAQVYQWKNMLHNQSNQYTALFLYHCALAIKSDFGTDVTTSYPYVVKNTLVTNYGFSDAILIYKSNYDDNSWNSLLKSEIDERHPIIYNGFGSSSSVGHSWVVDGYDDDNRFHFNVGWGGYCNGWYYLSNITIGGHNLNSSQNAIINIYPTTYTNLDIDSKTLNTSYRTGHTIRVTDCNVANEASVVLDADCNTEIFGTFSVPVGATLEVK